MALAKVGIPQLCLADRVHIHSSEQTLGLSQAMYIFHNSLVRNHKAAENSLCPCYTDRLFSLNHPIHSAS